MPKVMDAALSRFPRWFRALVVARFVLVTAGSLLVVVLLALPSSSSHF